MGKPVFSAIPVRAIGDSDLTDGDLRVLASVAAFDRMSHARKAGQGAWASHALMSGWIGRDYARFSTSISKLLKLGYLDREQRATNRRQFTYRVIYTDDDRLPQGKDIVDRQANEPGEVVCSDANDWAAIVCRDAPDAPDIVCRGGRLTHGKSIENLSQYISQSEGIDSAKAVGINSAKRRVENSTRLRDPTERIFEPGEPLGRTLAKFERQWSADPAFFASGYQQWADWLFEQAEAQIGADEITLGNWAQRLGEAVQLHIDDTTVEEEFEI